MKPLLVAASFVLVACGGSKPAPTAGENPCANPCGDAAAKTPEVDVSDWASWTKVSAARFFSKGHGKSWVDVYVKPELVEAYNAATGPYPQGATLVKAQYATEDTTDVARITVMVKREDGFDAEHGNWWYGVLSPDGKTAMAQGKVDMCITCHESASDRDYVFGPSK